MDARSAAPALIVGIKTFPFLIFTVLLLITAAAATPACACYYPSLPRAATATPHKADHPTFGIDNQGRVFEVGADLRGPIPPSRIADRVRGAHTSRPDDLVLYLVADADVQYSAVLSLVTAAQNAGVREIGLIAECPRGRESLMTHCRTAPAHASTR